MEDEAELVSGRHRRPDDPARRPAFHVQARGSTVVEARGSHAIYVSRPEAVAAIIRTATQA